MEVLSYVDYVGKKVHDTKLDSLSLITGAYIGLDGEVNLIINYVHQDKQGNWGASQLSEKLSTIKFNATLKILD